MELAQTLAVALRQRQQQSVAKTKYDFLVEDAVISSAEFELATRTARRKGIDIEDVLIDEFQVSLPALGAALILLLETILSQSLLLRWP